MADITKKSIVDDVLNILNRFSTTDDSRKDPDWLSNKIDQVRAQLIVNEYRTNGIVDQTWLTDLGLKTFHAVNAADTSSVGVCCSNISKCFIPNVVSLTSKFDSNIDLGVFSLMSACGTKEYTPFPMSAWKMIPPEHVRSKFNYYSRINTALYVNREAPLQLRPICILAAPADGYLVNSTPIVSGSIATGTVYVVKGGTVIYNATAYYSDDEFTGASLVTTFTGTGQVFLKSQLVALSATQPYPVTAEMARTIALEICTKEFAIEASQITDTENDSVDDEKKSRAGQ